MRKHIKHTLNFFLVLDFKDIKISLSNCYERLYTLTLSFCSYLIMGPRQPAGREPEELTPQLYSPPSTHLLPRTLIGQPQPYTRQQERPFTPPTPVSLPRQRTGYRRWRMELEEQKAT